MSTFNERKRRNDVSRRAFLGGAAGLMTAGGLWYPRKAMAAPIERKFLFFWAGGGWDTATILDPHYGPDGVSAVPGVDMDPNTYLGKKGGITYTSGPDRLDVDKYFRNWGKYSAIVRGVDTHSVGHDSSTQFMLTGTSASSYADWPTTVAANSTLDYPLPHIVFSGPSFPGNSASAVVRAGGGTLLTLIDGSINGQSDAPSPAIPPPADDMIDQFVYKRVAEFASQQKGLARDRADGMLSNVERAMELEGRQFEAGLDNLGNTLLDQMLKAGEMFRLGLSRSAMIQIPGGYDTHSGNNMQAPQQVAFYSALNDFMEHLANTPGHTADYLINEVVVVAMSDFGRTPKLNGGNGKDHWPYNSVLVAGAGVAGNKVHGYTDDSMIATPIDFSTGQQSSDSNAPMLGCENLGVALLKIGGLDPSKFLPNVPVLESLVR